MWNYYSLVAAQDRADRIAQTGFQFSATSREFKSEDIARHLRTNRKSAGRWVLAFLRKTGLVANAAKAPAERAEPRQAQIVPALSRSRETRRAQGVTLQTKKAA